MKNSVKIQAIGWLIEQLETVEKEQEKELSDDAEIPDDETREMWMEIDGARLFILQKLMRKALDFDYTDFN